MNDRDSLTGLYTREAFCYYAEEFIKAHPDVQYDIVLSDVVNFKSFNERYGVEAGDLLLIKTGEMLSMSGPDTICGRYGADRFVSLTPHLNEMGIAFLENFKLPEQAKNELPVESIIVKFGVCPNVDLNSPISVFCDRAYSAVTSVKHQYRKNVGIYDEHLGAVIKKEILIEENMNIALEENQFQVFYQPKMDLATNKLNGAEALVRWEHPKLGFMNPGQFVPLFEKNGFISAMDNFVWKRVCEDIKEWKDKGLRLVPISANASRRDFEVPAMSERVIELLDTNDVDHSLFHIEVTESSYADDAESVSKHIKTLHDAGVKIELDDFGVGFTSLASLNDMNIDILKLDVSLLKNLGLNTGRSVLEFAVQLANMLNLKTIQEGVETESELEHIKELGCDSIQGYLFSKPLSKTDFEKFLIASQA